MKIVHVSTYQTGGAAIAARRLHQLMLKNGINSKLIVLYKTIDEEEVYDFRDALSSSKNLMTKVNNKLYTLKQSQRLKQMDELFSPVNTAWKLEDHPLIQSADIVHLHWVEGFVNVYSFLDNCPAKIVWTLHDFAPISGGEHYPGSGYQPDDKRIAKTAAAVINGKLSFIAPSQYMLHNVPYETCSTHIPNAPDVDNYNSISRPVDSNTILYINADLNYKRKAHDLVEATLFELDQTEKLVSIGAFIPNKGKHIPACNDPKVIASELKSAKLLLFPTRNDNLPNMAIESILCGTPVLSHKVGGVPEIINPSNGYLCEAGSEITLNDVHQTMQTNAHEEIAREAVKSFNPTTILNQHLDYLQRVCR